MLIKAEKRVYSSITGELIKERTKTYEIDLEIGDKVLIYDGSWIGGGYMIPGGIYSGEVVMLDSKEICFDNIGDNTKVEIDQPILVLVNGRDLYYCNPLNLKKI